MATEEGKFPKVGNDPLYVSEINNELTALAWKNQAREALGFDRLQFLNPKYISGINTGSFGTGFITSWSGTSIYNGVIDNHDDSSIGSIWKVIGALAFNEDANYIFSTHLAGNTTNIGSVYTSGFNVFDLYGGAIRIQTGSFVGQQAGGGGGLTHIRVLCDSTVLYTKSARDWATSGITIDLQRIDENNFYYRTDSGTGFKAWNKSTFTSGHIIFGMSVKATGGGGVFQIGSMLIDFEHMISGVTSFESLYSGLSPLRYIDGGSPSTAVFTVIGTGSKDISSYNISLDGGANYTTGSDGKLTSILPSGTDVRLQVLGSITHNAGSDGGLIYSGLPMFLN